MRLTKYLVFPSSWVTGLRHSNLACLLVSLFYMNIAMAPIHTLPAKDTCNSVASKHGYYRWRHILCILCFRGLTASPCTTTQPLSSNCRKTQISSPSVNPLLALDFLGRSSNGECYIIRYHSVERFHAYSNARTSPSLHEPPLFYRHSPCWKFLLSSFSIVYFRYKVKRLTEIV